MMLSKNRYSFTFSFPIFTTLLPTALARIFRTISDRSDELKNPSLISDFRAKVVSLSPLNIMTAVGLLVNALYQTEKVLVYF